MYISNTFTFSFLPMESPMEAPKMEGPKPQKSFSMGWLWVVVIVIVVAFILFLTQQRAPSGEEEQGDVEEEVVIEVKDVPATVTFSSIPSSATAGTLFGIDWEVQADEETGTSHTAVYWGSVSHPGVFGTEVTGEASGYEQFTTAYADELNAVPGSFEDNIRVPDDAANTAIYLRAVAVIAGKSYWSEEISLPVKAFPVPGDQTK